MKLNQKGFGAIEGLLVAIALTLIVGVGYYVINTNKDDKKTGAATSSSQKSGSTAAEQKDLYGGWQTYTDAGAGFSLRYPADWKFNEKGSKTKDGEGEYGSNQFTSLASYEAGDNSDPMFLSTDNTTLTASKYAEDKWAQSAMGPEAVVSSKGSTINGHTTETVNFKSPTGNPTGYDVIVENKGTIVEFQYYANDSNKQNVETFKAIISSIKFN